MILHVANIRVARRRAVYALLYEPGTDR